MKQDLRITKTYLSLTNAFWELMKTKKYEEITVNEICEKAMIRRATFYKHFGDKNDFFSFIVRQKQKEFTKKYKMNSKEPHEYGRLILVSLFSFLDQNEELVNCAMGSSMLNNLVDILCEESISDISYTLHNAQINGVELPSSPDIMAQCFTGAMIQAAKCWLHDHKKIPMDEIIHQLEKIILKNI